MIDHERIEAYAKRLRWEVGLDRFVLVNVVLAVYHQLFIKSQEDVKPLDLNNDNTFNYLSFKFADYFYETFWINSAEWICTRLDIWKQTGTIPDKCTEDAENALLFPAEPLEGYDSEKVQEAPEIQLISACGFYAAKELLKQLNLPMLSVKALEVILGLTSEKPATETRIAYQSSLYTTRNIEPRPNHAAVSDLLRILPYPHKWEEAGLKLGSAHIAHSQERYVQYKLLAMDSTGDFIPITDSTAQDIVGKFDWVDHKILTVLLIRSIESGGKKFIISLSWLADLITEDRHQIQSESGKRKYLSRGEVLSELEKRIKRLRAISLEVRWHEGDGKKQKQYNLLMQEGLRWIEFALFLVPKLWGEKIGKKIDTLAEIVPGAWYEMYCNKLPQFTCFPKELLAINTYHNWRRYAIGNYVVTEYRNNLNCLKEVINPKNQQHIKVLRRKLETLIRDVLTPEEINYALTNSDKGWRLKKGILEDFTDYTEKGWYFEPTFSEGGFAEFMRGTVDMALTSENSQAILNARSNPPKVEPKRFRQQSKATITPERIKAARKAKGWTQMELVQALDAYIDISQRKVSFWESGKSQPSPQEATKLRIVLDLND